MEVDAWLDGRRPPTQVAAAPHPRSLRGTKTRAATLMQIVGAELTGKQEDAPENEVDERQRWLDHARAVVESGPA